MDKRRWCGQRKKKKKRKKGDSFRGKKERRGKEISRISHFDGKVRN